MKNIAEILLQVNSTSSKKEKEHIIGTYKDNPLFKEVLNQIYNPFLKTNIAKKKLAKKIKTIPSEIFGSDKEYIYYLQNKCTGKDIDIVNIQYFISQQPEEIRWLYEAMAIKTLKFGFTESTINKAFGYDFIPTFDVMLAEKYVETKRDSKGVKKVKKNFLRYVGYNVIATPKLDGNRCVIFTNDNGEIELLSRSGQVLEGYTEIVEAFKAFPKGIVYDGELLAINNEGLNSKELFQKTQKIVRTKGEKTGVMFHAFDMLPIEDFKKGGCSTPCLLRKNALESIVEKYGNDLVAYVKPLYIGMFDEEIIQKLSEDACEQEEEGIMVQLADAPYQLKRTFDILKVKVFESADLRVVDMYEGEGQNIGKLGGVIVDYKGYTVRVGGGYTKDEREDIWSNPDMVMDKIVEVQYFKESEDQYGNLSLRFPVFKTIREDKTEPSYY
ncbi:TPA: hypothetical protein QC364_000754 [Bacillus cereus]|nr:hypothetical protein [Bacillus cereus]